MKKTTYFLATVLTISLFAACQRNSTAPNRSATDAATIASGGNQTSDRTGQQPTSPDRAPANAAANSPAIGAPTVTSTSTPTPVNDSHQAPMAQDTTSRNVTKGAAPNAAPGTIWNNSTQVGNQPIPSNQTTATGMNAAQSQKVAEVSRQIDEVDAAMRNNPTEKQKADLSKKRQKLVKQLNKLQGTDKTGTSSATER